MNLADFTSLDLILPHLRSSDAPGAIRELSDLLARGRRIADAGAFARAATEREEFLDTDTGVGVAFPHVRVRGLKQLSIAVGRSDAPFAWGTTSSCPVRVVFLLAVPDSEVEQSLQLVSGLARLSMDEEQVRRFHAAVSPQEILELLRSIPVRSHVRT